MTANMLHEIAIELRLRAGGAAGKEREDLLFLAAEYDALAELSRSPDPERRFTVMLPK
jgi:hypothetical protein